jgi:hypothetical protein
MSDDEQEYFILPGEDEDEDDIWMRHWYNRSLVRDEEDEDDDEETAMCLNSDNEVDEDDDDEETAMCLNSDDEDDEEDEEDIWMQHWYTGSVMVDEWDLQVARATRDRLDEAWDRLVEANQQDDVTIDGYYNISI